MTGSSPNLAGQHLDVLVIGAGISGIGAAHYLRSRHPKRRVAVFEAREHIGGTWDLFRYPGIRSDSDLHTFGFDFKPWAGERTFASGAEILAYLGEAVAEDGLGELILTGHRVVALSWSSAQARWRATVRRADATTFELTADWIFAGTGYYRYDSGYLPELPAINTYRGRVVHPQSWPADLDCSGKRVVVIGSGATAVTLVPALARSAAHVTMLQRSPSYILSLPRRDEFALWLQRKLGQERGYRLARRKNELIQSGIYELCRRRPALARALIRRLTARQLPAGYPVERHFRPAYEPWDQRLCFAPSGDIFRAIREGRASVVTDRIETFTPSGLRLASGEQLDADVVVTATGLRLQALGGMQLRVDGALVDITRRVAFRGMMLDAVPNLVYLFGYTNASWTLKVGLVCEHMCRLLAHMDQGGYDTCVAELPYPHMPTRPLLDLSSGYVTRGLGSMPQQGPRAPWIQPMSLRTDSRMLRDGPVTDRNLHFRRARAAAAAVPDAAQALESTSTSVWPRRSASSTTSARRSA
jgi:cation diffusion facilitator CzcD-associated flavoprotein CzcO